MNVFVFTGSGTGLSWSIGGNYTIISQNGNALQVKWNSTISNTTVSCHASSNNTNAMYSNITIGTPVNPTISITSNKTSICSGGSVTFTATATNAGTTPSYQWSLNGTAISGANASTYTTTTLTNGAQISCFVYTSLACYTNYSASSNIITITVNSGTTMTVSISGGNPICTGSPTSFQATVTNPVGNITYQWKRNGINVSSNIVGPPPYVLAYNGAVSGDVFLCVITTDGCAAPATSNSITLTISTPQTFTGSVSPGTIYLCQGGPIVYTASGNMAISSYQWQMSGNNIAGATSSTYSMTVSSIPQVQSIGVVVTTSVGGCISNNSATATAAGIPFQINNPVTPSVSITQNTIPVQIGTAASFTANPVNGGTASYQWSLNGTPVSGANAATFTPTITTGTENQLVSVSMTSNLVCALNPATASTSFAVVSTNWENMNYVRVHNVMIPGIVDWVGVDNLPIGQKMQTTTYFDGLGRPIEMIKREEATAASGSQWGDIVQFVQYDAYGSTNTKYLPYSTVTESKKYKSAPLTEQPQYYNNNYSETFPYSTTKVDNSPSNRVINTKAPGNAWATSAGSGTQYDLNSPADSVHIFSIGYNTGDIPVDGGIYAANTLFRTVFTDDKGKMVIIYTNKGGQAILKKVQLYDVPTTGHYGWICTYSVYDDLGSLRYTLTPEAVNYLMTNGWTLAGVNGTQVATELCFRYEYDNKQRVVLKKLPGAQPLYIVYDQRDRKVFMQDGNQRAKSPTEWTANLFDELDRIVITTLYETNKTATALSADLSAAGGVSTVTTTLPAATISLYNNPILSTDLNNSSVTNIVKVEFYDTYGFSGVKSFNSSFDNYLAYSTSDPIVNAPRTLNFPTGSIVRVLGTTTFLSKTFYYDDKGRMTQTLEDNIKAGIDVTTNQYQFDGRLLSINEKHSSVNTGFTNYSIVTKYLFDQIGRVTGIQKKFGSNDFKNILNYDLDDMGRLKTRHLDPGYTGSGKTEMESLIYSYNIQNQLTGINADYALKTPGKYDKWGNYFGQFLGYDNKNGIFSAALLNGQLTGNLWSTQGDDVQRKYDFTYDNSGRLNKAAFNEKQNPGDAWSNAKMDFTVTGVNGAIQYDLNGNIQYMLQKGVIPGTPTPITVDDLHYVYNSFSNRLKTISDASTLGTLNGQLGDFKDGTNGASDDYSYDNNGNVVIDLNKNLTDLGNVIGANGMRYNYLDKIESFRLKGKGTVNVTYDADGNKILSSYTPDVTGIVTTTYFIQNYTFQGDSLLYINFEGGRIRSMHYVSQNNGYDLLNIDGSMDLPTHDRGAYDFFVQDFQQNVRMILTEENHSGSNSCTMELARAANEEPLFGKVDVNGVPTADNEVKARFAVSSIPGQASNNGWNNAAIGNYVSRIGNLATKKIGPNALLKVMAGDLVSASAIYYYQNPVTNHSGGTSFITDILTSLGQAISSGGATSGILHGATTASNITGQLSGSVPFSSVADPDAANPAGNNPKAYLTILFFDERFNIITTGSISIRVTTAGNGAPTLILPNIKAPKNGYAYVYVSNESDEMLYFDNLQVSNNHSRILEENHYYSFGLRITSLSSRKVGDINEGSLPNSELMQGTFSDYDSNLVLNSFDLRDYDPQIGKWLQQDAYDQYASPYLGMGNDPASNVDEDGGWSAGLTGMVIGAAAGFVAPYAIEAISGKHIDKKGLWGLGGAFVGAGLGYGAGASLAGQGGFFNNVAAFYDGLLGLHIGEVNGNGDVIFGNRFSNCFFDKASIPDLWGWVGNIKLPSFGFLKAPIYHIGEPVLINVFFHVNEAVVDIEKTKEGDISKQIRRLERTLGKYPDADFVISGGTIWGDPNTIVTKPRRKDFDPKKDKSYEGQPASNLARDRAQEAKDYIKKRIRKKYRDRLSTDGQILKTGDPPKAVGQLR